MTVGRFVKCRCYHLGVDTAAHVGHLLGTLVDEQYHDISLGVIFSYGIGNILEKNGLTRLGRSHDETALTLAYRREHVDHTGGYVAASARGEIKFFVGEQRREMLESHTVTYKLGRTTVDGEHTCEREIFFICLGRTHIGLDHIARTETVLLDLLLGDKHIIGRREIIVIARAEKSVPLRLYLKHSRGNDDVVKIILGLIACLLLSVCIVIFVAVFLILLALLLLLLFLHARLVDCDRSCGGSD